MTVKKNEQYNEKLMFEIAQENKRLNEPLQKANTEVENLRHAHRAVDRDIKWHGPPHPVFVFKTPLDVWQDIVGEWHLHFLCTCFAW